MTDTIAVATCPECGTEQRVKTTGRLYKHGKPPCPGSDQPVGEARIPKPYRGYYTDPITGQKLRRVTSITSCAPKGERLVYWAGNTVAETALDYLPKLVRESRTPQARKEAIDWLRHAHTRKKDDRAHIGTAVHQAIECSLLDLPIPSPIDLVPAKVTDQRTRSAMAEEIAACLKAFRCFVTDFAVRWTASEMKVANYEHAYAGTLDWMAHFAGYGHRMGDTKTGGELDVRLDDGTPKGVYPEAGIQMAAYRHCTVAWLRNGTRVELPATESTGFVLHLRPEGYRCYPARAGDEEFQTFLGLMDLDRWVNGSAKTVIGEPVAPHRHDPDGTGGCRTPGCVDNPIGNPFQAADSAAGSATGDGRHLRVVADQDWS